MSTYTVQSVSESPAGISVSVSVPPDGNKEAETAEFLISREQWAWGRLSPGDAVSEEEYGRMEHAAVFSPAGQVPAPQLQINPVCQVQAAQKNANIRG